MKRLLLSIALLGFLWGASCKVSSEYEREIHPDNWISIHGEKVKNSGTIGCDACHPPQGNAEDAPSCQSCHGES